MTDVRRSVTPDQARQAALDLDTSLIITLRLVARVGGVESDHSPFAPIGLESRFLIVDQGNHNLAVTSVVDLPNESKIAVENPFLDHRVARDLESIMLARAK